MIRQNRVVELPAKYREDSPETVEEWLDKLTAALEKAFRDVRNDTEYGAVTHQRLTAAPSADDLEDGQIVLVTSGGTDYLFTKIDNTLKKATLT